MIDNYWVGDLNTLHRVYSYTSKPKDVALCLYSGNVVMWV